MVARYVTIAFSVSVANAASLTSCSGAHATVESRQQAFDDFVKQYDRSYVRGSGEWGERFSIFEANLAKVDAQNCNGDRLWKAVINKHSDRRPAELSSLLGWKRTASPAGSVEGSLQLIEDVDVDSEEGLPESVDYKYLPAMQEVEDQGMCGSCWAVAAAVTLRANYHLYHDEDRTFSPQELVSCTENPRECGGTGGCDGATAEIAMDYVLHNGCRTKEELKYEARDATCPSKESLRAGKDTGNGKSDLGMVGWKTLPSNKAVPLMKALAETGPVAVSVAASDSWFMYGGGIMGDCDKSDPIVNHAVVLVGYGSDSGTKYWEIQNSWGVSWGERGFLKLKRQHGEEKDYCGWDTKPQDGVACKDDKEPKVYVCGMCGILYDSVVPFFAGAKANSSSSGSGGNLRSQKKHKQRHGSALLELPSW